MLNLFIVSAQLEHLWLSLHVCRFYQDLSYEERSKMLKDRLKKYSQKARPATCPKQASPLMRVSHTPLQLHPVLQCCLGAHHVGHVHMHCFAQKGVSTFPDHALLFGAKIA